jgi:hypothetical protein
VGAHRRAAERVLELAGTLEISNKSGQSRSVTDAARLPEEPFELDSITVSFAKFTSDDTTVGWIQHYLLFEFH